MNSVFATRLYMHKLEISDEWGGGAGCTYCYISTVTSAHLIVHVLVIEIHSAENPSRFLVNPTAFICDR